MPRFPKLDPLKTREQDAFHRKQEAYQRYKEAKDRASTAHDIMQSAWEERCRTREFMNHEYEVMKASSEHFRATWDEYGRIRDANNSRIESLRYEADREHEEMKACFDRASDAYEYGDKAEAPIYSAEGHDHKERRDQLNAEISALIQEIRDAKANAQYQAPKTDSSSFHEAKERFNAAKTRHESAEAEFKTLKAERDRYKAEFDSAQAEHTRLKDEFTKKLTEATAARQRNRDRILDKAGIGYFERKDAKIVKKSDGTTQVYHGGLGTGDGYGHGHTALDRYGNKTYDRGAFEAHGSQNYTDSKKTLAVGTDRLNGKPAKIRHRKDGRTDIYFNSSGNFGDGLGHGHVVLAPDGHVSYIRDENQGKGQYLIDESKEDHTKI